jgi:hypothetical protein
MKPNEFESIIFAVRWSKRKKNPSYETHKQLIMYLFFFKKTNKLSCIKRTV